MSEPATQPNLTVTPLDQKELAKMQEAAPKVLLQAQELEINTTEDYEASGAFLDVVAERQRKVEEFFERPVKEANSVHKFLTSLRGMLTSPYSQAEELIKRRRRDWRMEEERKRQAAEEEARKRAKAEQEAQALEEASQLTEIGEHEAAAVVIDRAVTAPPPPVIVPSIVPKQAGHSIRKVWKFRIKNPALIKREFLMPKNAFDPKEYKKIDALVSDLGPDAGPLVGPGAIEIYEDEIESSRRK